MTAKHEIGTTGGGALHPARPDVAAESGFTIIELVVAMTVFAILLGVVAYSSGTLMGLTRRNLDRSVAANLASQEIDRVRKVVTASPDITQGTTTTNATVGGVAYRVKTSLGYTAASGNGSLCAEQSGSTTKVISVNVRVEWPPYGTRDATHAVTEVAPGPGADGTTTKGAIPVTVHDASGGALQGAIVTVTGSTGSPVYLSTDQQGCAYFLMAAGSYTVTATRSGYVDRNDNPTPVKGFALATGATMPQQFELAAAGYLGVSFASPRGGEVPTALTFSLAYWKYAAPGYLPFTTSGAVTPVGPLFPDGHQVWAGSCTDADPMFWGVQRGAALPVASGSTTDAPVDLPALDVTVLDGSNLPVAGASITAIHDDAASPCGSSLGSPPAIAFTGTTDASGYLRISLPFGHWRIQASGPGGTGSSTTALDPSDLDDAASPLPPTLMVAVS